MNGLVPFFLHESQSPEALASELMEGLRRREVPHKFLYESRQQTSNWLRLHRQFSPAHHDPDLVETYRKAFQTTAERTARGQRSLISFGPGSGEKDAAFVTHAVHSASISSYLGCDTALPLLVETRKRLLEFLRENRISLLHCDLSHPDDLKEALDTIAGTDEARTLLFFGMLNNSDGARMLKGVAKLLTPKDIVLLNIYTTSDEELASGLANTLPGYKNPLATQWVESFFDQIGFPRGCGHLEWRVEEQANGVKRIAAWNVFDHPAEIELSTGQLIFTAGEEILAFYSNRFSSIQAKSLIEASGLVVQETWVPTAKSETIFSCSVS